MGERARANARARTHPRAAPRPCAFIGKAAVAHRLLCRKQLPITAASSQRRVSPTISTCSRVGCGKRLLRAGGRGEWCACGRAGTSLGGESQAGYGGQGAA